MASMGNYRRGANAGRSFVVRRFNDYFVFGQGSYEDFRATVEEEARQARLAVVQIGNRHHDPAEIAYAKGYADGLLAYRDPIYTVRRKEGG